MKNIGYSKLVKLLLYISMVAFSIGGIYSLYGLAGMPREKNYYSSYGYEYELITKAGYVRDWIVRYADEKILEKDGVSSADIKRYRTADTSVTSDEQAIAGILSDRHDYYEFIQDQLVRDNVNVEYIGIDKGTGKVITNSPLYKGSNLDAVLDDFLKSPTLITGDGEKIKRSFQEERTWNYIDGVGTFHSNYYNGSGVANKENYAIYVRTKENLQPGDSFYERAMNFEKATANKDMIYVFGALSFVLGLLNLIGWIKVIGQKEPDGEVSLNFFDKIPFEIQAIGFGFILLIWASFSFFWINDIMVSRGWVPYTLGSIFSSEEFVLMVLIASGVAITLVVLSSFVRHFKNKSMSSYILVWRLGKWAKEDLLNEKTLPLAAALVIIGYVVINLGLIYMICNVWGLFNLLMWLMFFSFNGLMLLLMIKITMDYVRLSRGIETLAKGNLNSQVKLSLSLPVMNRTANQINHIGGGLEAAVEQSLKSERLKTELITNVSHDLKTPLTSIISYIDLLKEEPIENKTVTEYIEILDERSHRLKQLVEDLVEASKAATGNVKAELMPTRLDQLVIQAVGEYTDRLEASELEVVFNQTEEVEVLADGRHMWRIIENLLSNTCKYAMPNTRVYVDVVRKEGKGCLILKNISKEPLAIEPSELTERFVRGESSRSSEGSGLGLAIATSLAQVQGGTLKLEIDGDLFKAIVEMPQVAQRPVE